jgi:hypothetical protein
MYMGFYNFTCLTTPGMTRGFINSCKQSFTVTTEYADTCKFFRNKKKYIYTTVRDALKLIKLMGPIQFQSHLVFLHLPNGMLYSQVDEQW